MGVTEQQPLIPVRPQLRGSETPTLRMLRVVMVDLSMTLETQSDCVANVLIAIDRGGFDVVDLDLHAAVPMTDTATAMALYEESLYVGRCEFMPGHFDSFSPFVTVSAS
jgi:hypothetical protein